MGRVDVPTASFPRSVEVPLTLTTPVDDVKDRVEVPLSADPEFQNGILPTVTALDVVTVPDPPPPPEQVDVVTLPEPSTERQPLAPASAVIERFVVVAWPLIVVEASDAIPPD